jgi:hypothetical protein
MSDMDVPVLREAFRIEGASMPRRKIAVRLPDAVVHWFVKLNMALIHRLRHRAGLAA